MPLIFRDTGVPAAEPVTLAQAHTQLNLDASFADDDAYITGKIVAARQYCEALMHRAIFNRTMSLWLDFFPYVHPVSTVNPADHESWYYRGFRPKPIRLPRPLAVSIESITYVDPNAATQTLDPRTYCASLNSIPARIVPLSGYWPITHPFMLECVCVSYTAGSYGDGVEVNTCPQTICQAMLLLVGHFYNHRDATDATPPKEIDMGVRDLLKDEIFDSF